MGEERLDAHSTPPGRKLSVSEAAEVLGISAEAVRSRVKRGTLRSVEEGSSVYVLLAADKTAPEQSPDADQTAAWSPSDTSALISELRAHNATLQEQLQAERQGHAEARRIIAGLVERIPPAIDPGGASGAPPDIPSGARGSPETAAEGPGEAWDTSQHSEATGAERPEEPRRRSWWREFFGFGE